jgi:uncharacterized membrane protein
MQEEDPLTNKEITTINIDLSKNNLSQNINYGDIKPLPLPQMKNIHQFIMNCVKNEEYCYSFIDFLKKFYHFKQIDYYLAYMNIIYCFSPLNLAEMSKTRKHLKNKYSRDDPGFLLIIIINLFISSICFNLTLSNFSIYKIFNIFFVQTFVLLILSGLIIALITKILFDNYLNCSSSQSIEYTHAFDIHTNSFVSFYFFSIIIPYFLLPITSKDKRFFEIFISNVLFFYGLIYYFYVSYIEYFSLPSVRKNQKINIIFWIIIMSFFIANLLKINMFKVFLYYVVV